jgi:hypothetical protein
MKQHGAHDHEPIPYELTAAAHRDLDSGHAARRELVMSFADAPVFSSADLEAIGDAFDRGDYAEVERLHAGRPLLTPLAAPDALDRARAAVAALPDLDECIRPVPTADDADSDASVLS